LCKSEVYNEKGISFKTGHKIYGLGSILGPARRGDNLTAIYELIVYKMWEPQHLTTLWGFMACYRDTFTLLQFSVFEELEYFSSSHRGSSCSCSIGSGKYFLPEIKVIEE
jgi:hypothetical protein